MVGVCRVAKLVPHVPEDLLRLALGGLLLYLVLLFVFDLEPSHPAGLMLAPFTMFAGWITRRLRRRPAVPEPPTERHEYYI